MTGAADGTDDTGEIPAEPGAADAATHGMDDVLGREVALVTLPPVSGPALDDRVERIRRLARLHHPHLLEVYDVDGLDDDAEHVLVLERGGGRPLDEITAETPLPLQQVAEIGARIASALAQVHRHDVVHGRLGPASVLVEDDQHVWLVGLTASLQDDPTGPAAATSTVADDLRALAWTLARAVDPAEAEELAVLLAGAREGRGSADELSGRLLRRARRDAIVTDTTGFPAAGTSGGTAAAGAGPVALRRLTARSLAGTGAVAGATTAGSAATGSTAPGVTTPGSTGSTASPGRASRPAGGLVGRGARLATLAAVALLLGLTSGVLIWGQETQNWFGAARSAPEAAAPAAPPATVPPAASTAGDGSATGAERRGSDRDRSTESEDTSRSDDGPSASRPTPGAAPAPGAPVLPAPVTTTPAAPPTTGPTTRPTTPGTTPPDTSTTRPTTRPTTPSTTSDPDDETSTPPSATSSTSRGDDGDPGDDGGSAATAGSGDADRA